MSNETSSALSRAVLCMILLFEATLAHAEFRAIDWERLVGIDPNPIGGQVIAGVNPVTYPWSVSEGSASLKPGSGLVRFELRGLSIGANPTSLALIGTTGAVTHIKGTFVCNSTGEYLDTEAVSLSSEGDASFRGRLPYAIPCDDDSWIFLIRIAGVLPGAPPIGERWLAHGAVRKSRMNRHRAAGE